MQTQENLVWEIRRELGLVFRELARQKECEIIEAQPDARLCAYADLDSAEVFGGRLWGF